MGRYAVGHPAQMVSRCSVGDLTVAALFCGQAVNSEIKLAVAKRWLAWRMPEIRMNTEMITSGDTQIVDEFETLAGPVPVVE